MDAINANLEAKLKELLYKINSFEIKICSDATKEFIKLLKGENGCKLLNLYAKTSPKCSELLDAWKLQRGKAGMPYIFSLISAILSHPDGIYRLNDLERLSTSRVLDMLARSLVEECLGDINSELGSQEVKRKNAALLLMSSIVRRGSRLASQVAKNFDFKLRAFSKLTEFRQKPNQKGSKHSSRKLFIGFAMSFLEVGKPELLRWVLQQREMYSGVLRGLANDDDETITYVLSTLRDKVLVDESLVPPGLRSVLFGSVTLEQLATICGREDGGLAAETAYQVLTMVCTDPCNGLMPNLERGPNPLKGNPKRLIDLMKKLKATGVIYHRDLLLAIIRGQPAFCSTYLEEFPYNLEDFLSPTWFSVVSLIVKLVSSVSSGLSIESIVSQSDDTTSFDNTYLKSIVRCLSSRPFSRSVINKGLLHSNILVKHGTLRLLLEALKLVDSLFGVLIKASSINAKKMLYWLSLKQELQNEVQTLLPDPQVLLTLLSSLGSQSRVQGVNLKRTAGLECSFNGVKKLKTTSPDHDTDIVVIGVVSDPNIDEKMGDNYMVETSKKEMELMISLAELWDLDPLSTLVEVKDAEMYFLSKLLDGLTIYYRRLPHTLEGSFEFFINLLGNPLLLPTILQHSLLSLLIEYIPSSSMSSTHFRTPPGMYKHLQPFITLFIRSPDSDIRNKAYYLAQASILSTGALDQNVYEVGSWFLYLSNYDRGTSFMELGIESSDDLIYTVISFLCDAISTVGNNLFKYWGILKSYTNQLKDAKDVSPNFSPIIICVLQKCLRLLSSDSVTFTRLEKAAISNYVSSTLKYLLQTQVDALLLASVIESILAKIFDDHGPLDVKSGSSNCEWRPLKNLLLFSCRLSAMHNEDVFPDHCHLMNDEEKICCMESDKIEASSSGFSTLLKRAPFHVLFPAIMCTHGSNSLVLPKIQDYLLLKLSELTIDHLLLSYLRLVLFWMYQIRISYRCKPLVELEQLSQICIVLLHNILAKLLASRTHSGTGGDYMGPLLRLEVQDVAETICSHPAVISSLSSPLNCPGDLMNDAIDLDLESLVHLSRKNVNTLDHHIVNLLTTFFEYLITSCDDQDSTFREVVETFNVLIQRLFSEFRDRFDIFIETMNPKPLLPLFFALHALNHFISPFDLLELVIWIFKRVNINGLVVQKSETTQIHGLSFGFGIAVIAFKDVTGYLQLPLSRRFPYNLLRKMDEKDVCNIIDEIYTETNIFAMHYKSEFADTCLLEVVKAICAKKSMLCEYFDQIHLAMFRFIMNVPSELISYCINGTNKEKAKLLFILTEVSSLHLSTFGNFIVDVMNKHSCHMDTEMEDKFLMLLPTSLTYLNSVVVKFGKKCWYNFKIVSSVYSRILFRKWKIFVTKSIFDEEFGDLVPSSTQEFLDLVNNSLLGKAVSMLRHCFALNGDLVTVKMRLKIFNYIIPASCSTDEVLGFEVDELDSYPPRQVFNFLSKVVAKISFCRVLLFPEGCSIQSLPREDVSTEYSSARRSNKEESSRLQYLNILVGIWQWIVKRFAFISDIYEKEMENSRLFRYLELFLLNNILELSTEMHDKLVKLLSIPFLEQLMRFSLLYRFEDPTTLNILYSILNLLSDGKFAEDVYLQLLLAHSQFASTIHSAPKPSHSIETFLRPMSSILRSLVIPSSSQQETNFKQDSKATRTDLKRLVIVKLVHILVLMKVRHGGCGKDDTINFRELHSLLLSSYGATISETDSTILMTLNDIETIVGSDAKNLVQMDFLWGNAVVGVSKERLLEQEPSSNISNDAEALKERHRNQFRENFPVDPRICVSTVLWFPYDRTELDEESHLKKYRLKDLDDLFKGHFHGTEPEQYDPVYVLRFSIHALSMGYIEALEFATLGLLAIAFVSLSSANDRLRKLGYGTLGALKDVVENCKRRKGTMRLRLLLTYVQNGIEEPWQRIPSIIALFAAEASFILLEPSHHHYAAISKFLVQSTRMNRKSIPLFKNFLWSSSVNFKSERLWMLRLVYVGINVDDDARLYIKNSIHEDLQSFYVSSLSDYESKELILQVMKKSVKVQRMAFYLVENGLFSWLCSIISASSTRLTKDQKSIFSKQLILVLEVVNDVISFRNICEWLQKDALEQLMEFSSNIFKILLGGEQFLLIGALVNQILQIITSVLRISQKRKIFQPHYTFSIEGLFHIYQAVHKLDYTRQGSTSASGLKMILMNMPQISLLRMDPKRCSDFLSWAVSTALEFDSRIIAKESHLGLTSESEEEHFDESLTSKLLRWLSASAILGKVSLKLGSLNLPTSERLSAETLYSLLEHVKSTRDDSSLQEFGCEELIAANIFYLQHLQSSFMVLPVVISALCLLLFDVLISAGLFRSHGADLAQHLSKIRCPEEVNPAWRWTFYQPWKDYSLELTDLQKMDEVHACQTLQLVISNILSKKPLDLQVLLPQNTEISRVFEWERNLIRTHNSNP